MIVAIRITVSGVQREWAPSLILSLSLIACQHDQDRVDRDRSMRDIAKHRRSEVEMQLPAFLVHPVRLAG